MVLEAIKYQRGSLEVLDQLQLPHKTHYDEVRTSEEGWRAIREMRVRGAPAIAMVGILSVAVEIERYLKEKVDGAQRAVGIVKDMLDYVVTSRPTAVHLNNMANDFKSLASNTASQTSATANDVFEAYQQAAIKTLAVDLRDNKLLGDHGAKWILENAAARPGKVMNIITHCNTGSLATAGYGTALGVIRSAHSIGALKHAYCTETRPYNQGSRLTAYELLYEEIPAMLITDSMAAFLMHTKNEEDDPITAVVVGADRIAANGDTANKIGTYALAIAAKQHGVKFLVAALCSSVDLQTATGERIKIEERASSEMTTISGPVVSDGQLKLDSPPQRVSTAASGINVWNPAFDVTPASLIDAIVTEKGVITKDGNTAFNMTGICAA